MGKHWLLLVMNVWLFLPGIYARQTNGDIPHLRRQGKSAQMIVHDRPFLMLGGELGNSSASSLAYMQPIWPKLQQLHVNTLLTPVYWELMEPEEGHFDFSLTDSLIQSARQHNIKLVLLWFGSWKNSMSCYAPAWVKKNTQRFPRAKNEQGKSEEILSAFDQRNLEADQRAFTALLQHIRETDSREQTVIMIQVENEIGMLPNAREHTTEANALFKQDVPAELLRYLQQHKQELVPELKARWDAQHSPSKGNWEAVFGKGLSTEEIFQAWHYARYANAVAEAGKKAYPLPMYVNAALPRPGKLPGEYPSAGPLPHLMDIWQAAAKAIDVLSPDFYNPDFKYWNDLYTRQHNPLFIPEIRFEPADAAKVFYAIGHYGAMGFSPFSIESTDKPEEEPIAKSYNILQQLSPLILEHQGSEQMEGVLLDKRTGPQEWKSAAYTLKISHDYSLGWSPAAKDTSWPQTGGIIIQTGEDEYIVAGTGLVVTFSVSDKSDIAGILQADEGIYVEGKWQPGRRMNGDQDHQGRHLRIPAGEWGIQRVKLYRYK
jgi:hypothetical protein